MSGPLSPASSAHINATNTSSRSATSRAFKDVQDISALRSSSVDHFRNLAQNATNNGSEIILPGVTDNSGDIAGMLGRLRLQKPESAESSTIRSRNWMETQRKSLQAYEYLCHIGEAKEWIQACINEEIPPVIQLEEALRDGVVLAQLTKVFDPKLVRKIFQAPKLQWRHADNINAFFGLLDEADVPELFRFELTDLYNKKNIPKVIYCIHALSWILSSQGLAPEIGDLVGKLEFTNEEIRDTQRGLDAAGVNVPNFRTMAKQLPNFVPSSASEPEELHEPEETEEARIQRSLSDCSSSIITLQAAITGAIVRSNLRAFFDNLADNVGLYIALQNQIRGRLLRSNLIISTKALTANEDAYILIQSAVRGRNTRKVVAPKLLYKEQSNFAVVIQSSARRYLARERLKAIFQILQAEGGTISELTARVRGLLVRRDFDFSHERLGYEMRNIVKLQACVRRHLQNLKASAESKSIMETEDVIAGLQACIRGCLRRRNLDRAMVDLHASTSIRPLGDLQAVVRGQKFRRQFFKDWVTLTSSCDLVTELNARTRGSLLRTTLAHDFLVLAEEEDNLLTIKSNSRRYLVKKRLLNLVLELQGTVDELVLLQSEARGFITRTSMNISYVGMMEASSDIVALQSHARGNLARYTYYHNLRAIDESEGVTVVPLQSLIRGALVRTLHLALLEQLSMHMDDIVEFQALIRGAITRVDLNILYYDLEEEECAIADLQNYVRGFMVRKKFAEQIDYFERNMKAVIKIQSFVRAKQQMDAYKALTTGSSPPLGTVKNFVHLLTDSDLDFEEEVEYEKLRNKAVDDIQKNDQLEQYIDQLDVKIALLVKNKITLDEVIKHQHGGIPKTRTNRSDPLDLKSLNKTSRRRLELYQGIFYVLQTQPTYLCNLLQGLDVMRVTDKEMKAVELAIMSLFGYAQNRREEFFMIKLISQAIGGALANNMFVQSLVKGHCMWTRLFAAYSKRPEGRQFVKELVGGLVESITKEDDLDIESDPLTIYHTSINNEELQTGRRSQRDHNVLVEFAAKDPETRSTFIKNLQRLREYSVLFMKSFKANIENFPYGIRYIGREIFRMLQRMYPQESEERLLSIILNTIYNRYINAAIVAPDMFGLHDMALNQLQKKNLTQVARTISQISSGKVFSEDSVFLQPLNENLVIYIAQMREMTRCLIDVPDLEEYFEMSELDDITSPQRPTLYAKTADIHALHALVHKYGDIMAPDNSDPLRSAITELGAVPSTTSDILNNSNLTELKLDLNPNFVPVTSEKAEINALMVEAKRCLMYIIRVQTGPDLLSILVKPVTEQDEQKYHELLDEDSASKSGTTTYSSGNVLGDLKLLKYRDLKVIALEKIITLEKLGKITRQNKYQDLVNSIANDIRTKRNRRVRRRKELEDAQQTLINLTKKEEYLQTKLKSYNDYIEHSMSTLQARKGKRRLVMPFTKQYFHMRELGRAGHAPKFGSFKYSATKLIEKGVLLDIKGFTDRQCEKVDFTFSSDQVGVFFVEASQGSITLPAGSIELPLEDLLDKQFNNCQTFKLFDNMATFNTNLLLHLLFKKFYRDG
ncbi:uncharacterized protein V1518DRAFT_409778 [Limtongia smithiae]|uniref:uncharacterized protein n=1 Tax=Limtongia smithiae TaxID=1125753 RepID=UPI0034CD34CC